MGVALTHLLDLPEKLAEARYMAGMFCALIVTSLVLATALALDRHALLAIHAAGAVAGMTIAGYVLSRTVGLPRLEDHVGMWMDPVGIASLVLEASLVALALRTLPLPAPGHRRAAASPVRFP